MLLLLLTLQDSMASLYEQLLYFELLKSVISWRNFFIINSLEENNVPFPDEHKPIKENGRHTACCAQHELIMHTDVFDAHSPVILLQGTRREHKAPGAQ
jgi:hypothetical protein